MSLPRQIAADIALLQQLTVWLEQVPLNVERYAERNDVTTSMLQWYITLPTPTVMMDEVKRVIRAAQKTASAVRKMEREKENLAADIQAVTEALPEPVYNTRRIAHETAATIGKRAQEHTTAERKLAQRASSTLTTVQLTYVQAYHTARDAIKQHRQDTAAEQKEEQKQQRAQERERAREQRDKIREDERLALERQRELELKAKQDNEAGSREFNRTAAELNREMSKQQRQKRQLQELQAQAIQKRLLVLTARELQAAGIVDPAADLIPSINAAEEALYGPPADRA